MQRTTLCLIASCLLLATTLTGCGAVQQARNAANRAQMSNNLKMLGLAYHQCHDQMQRGPLNWQEAQQNGLPTEVQAQLEAEGYTVHWGVKFADATGGTAIFVLAYPANATTSDSNVLMLDGSVHFMTAQEFNDALAQQKIDSPKAMAAAADSGAAPPPADAASPPGPPAAPGY